MRVWQWIILLSMWATCAVAQAPPPPPPPAAVPPPPGVPPVVMVPGAPGAVATPAAPAEPPPPLPDKYHSIFFTEQEMELFRPYIDDYRNRRSLKGESGDLIDELMGKVGLGDKQEAVAIYTYPQFFLASIAYHHADNWTVWVNDFKFTPAMQQIGKLTLTELSMYEARFRWNPDITERIDYEKTPGPNIKVDGVQRIIEFSLRPNQTFSSYLLQTLEGKVQSVGVQITRDGALANRTAAPKIPDPQMPSDPPAMLNEATKDQTTGIGGLINRYKTLENTEGAAAPAMAPPPAVPMPSSPPPPQGAAR